MFVAKVDGEIRNTQFLNKSRRIIDISKKERNKRNLLIKFLNELNTRVYTKKIYFLIMTDIDMIFHSKV